MCVIEINVSLLLRESQAANDLIFFPFRRGRFILEKILRDVLCACLWQEAFLLCFCLVLWDVWSVFWGLLVSVPVCAHTIVQLLWNYGVVPWPLDINPQLHGSQCPQGSDSCLADFKGKVFTDFRIIIGCVDDHHLKLIVYFLLAWVLWFWHFLIILLIKVYLYHFPSKNVFQ